MSLNRFFKKNGWRMVKEFPIPGRNAEYFDYDDLKLSKETINYLNKHLQKGLYRHQKKAIAYFLDGKNICLTTGTASGKSLVFYVAAIEQLVKFPNSKIIAIYPLKALGREQQERWERVLESAGLSARVGRIDGQVSVYSRGKILGESQVVILTPDVIHAWLMYNLSDRIVWDFFSRISLIVIDEVHNYTGVFGSNSAYLFRRMRHVMSLLNCKPQYIAASATIAEPETHLYKLTGLNFTIIGSNDDTSPKQNITIKLVEPPKTIDLLTSLSNLLEYVALFTDHKFIMFVDSRKQAEYIASITSRSHALEETEEFIDYDHLQKLHILPYRAGYEETDREIIQKG